MSFKDSLNHKCNIYRAKKTSEKQGYALPDKETFSYSKEPTEYDVACHFSYGSNFGSLKQQEPRNIIDEQVKLVYEIGEDIRENDKIEDCQTGLFYLAGLPINVRNHHMYVMLRRSNTGKAI